VTCRGPGPATSRYRFRTSGCQDCTYLSSSRTGNANARKQCQQDRAAGLADFAARPSSVGEDANAIATHLAGDRTQSRPATITRWNPIRSNIMEHRLHKCTIESSASIEHGNHCPRHGILHPGRIHFALEKSSTTNSWPFRCATPIPTVSISRSKMFDRCRADFISRS
jgi:hypothetical protein